MGRSTNADPSGMITDINVTPLVDVVLVLLVIFMITAPAIYQSAIRVDLPKAISGEKAEKITLKITLKKNGVVMLGNEQITKDKLPEVIKMALERDPTANAIVAADRNIAHGDVIAIVDELKANGIKKLAIGVESASAKKR